MYYHIVDVINNTLRKAIKMINDTKLEPKRFTLRIDKNLFEEIKKRAKLNRRAIGKEIEYILFQSTGSTLTIE